MQSSHDCGIFGGLVPATPVDTKICRCSSPFVRPLYPMAQYLWIWSAHSVLLSPPSCSVNIRELKKQWLPFEVMVRNVVVSQPEEC